jgi:tetratricopeptide (TPR) repeat protein
MVACLALLLAAPRAVRSDEADNPHATATPPIPPTTPEQFEMSRREYAEGVSAYERGDYSVALKHFQSAYASAPSPEYFYNIARCQERLGRWAEAASAYELYLAGKPTIEDAVQIRERISDLRVKANEIARLAATPPVLAPSPPALPTRSFRVPALVLLGVTLVLAGGGVGAYFSEWSDYHARRDACQGQCSPDSLDGLRTRVLTAEATGIALFALAGAALVADIVLWAADARHSRRESRLQSRARDDTFVVRF